MVFWRNTAFGNQYVLNILAGYEWSIGRKKNNALLVDLRFSATGGKPYIPIDLAASIKAKGDVRDTKNAYLPRLDPFHRSDLKVSFRFNRPKVTHYVFAEVTNVFSEEVALTVRYDNPTRPFKRNIMAFGCCRWPGTGLAGGSGERRR